MSQNAARRKVTGEKCYQKCYRNRLQAPTALYGNVKKSQFFGQTLIISYFAKGRPIAYEGKLAEGGKIEGLYFLWKVLFIGTLTRYLCLDPTLGYWGDHENP